MTVKELVEELSRYDGDTEIFLSTDEEGNGFNELVTIDSLIRTSTTRHTTSHSGTKATWIEVEFFEHGEPAARLRTNKKEVIILWP